MRYVVDEVVFKAQSDGMSVVFFVYQQKSSVAFGQKAFVFYDGFVRKKKFGERVVAYGRGKFARHKTARFLGISRFYAAKKAVRGIAVGGETSVLRKNIAVSLRKQREIAVLAESYHAHQPAVGKSLAAGKFDGVRQKRGIKRKNGDVNRFFVLVADTGIIFEKNPVCRKHGVAGKF